MAINSIEAPDNLHTITSYVPELYTLIFSSLTKKLKCGTKKKIKSQQTPQNELIKKGFQLDLNIYHKPDSISCNVHLTRIYRALFLISLFSQRRGLLRKRKVHSDSQCDHTRSWKWPATVSPRRQWAEPHCVCVCCGEMFVVLFTFSPPVISFAVTVLGISLQVVAAVCSVP